MSIFERFFGKEPIKKLEPEKVTTFKLEDITVSKSGNRVILYIPTAMFNKIGGLDAVTKDIFSTVFVGQAMWAEQFDTAFAVEVPGDEIKIKEFRRKILAKALE